MISKMKTKRKPKPSITNRRARFDYEIMETHVAGIVLEGTEVKSLREGRCNMVDSYCFIQSGELFLKGLDIPIGNTHSFQHEPRRTRKLLLKKREILKLERSLIKGLTIIPLKIFDMNGRFKCEIGLARGKKLWDKRDTIRDRDQKRERERYDKN